MVKDADGEGGGDGDGKDGACGDDEFDSDS